MSIIPTKIQSVTQRGVESKKLIAIKAYRAVSPPVVVSQSKTERQSKCTVDTKKKTSQDHFKLRMTHRETEKRLYFEILQF